MTQPLLLLNPRHGLPGVVTLPDGAFRRARTAIAAWNAPPPPAPRALPALAAALGLAAVHHVAADAPSGLREHGIRFAAERALVAQLARARNAPVDLAALQAGAFQAETGAVTLAAQAGFDGDDRPREALAVIRAARHLGARCAVLVPHGTPAALTRPLSDADAVLEVAATPATLPTLAATRGWLLVSDLAQPGFTETPRDAMQGYRAAVAQLLALLPAPPHHLLIGGGTGALAAAFAVALRAAGDGASTSLILHEPPGRAPFAALLRGSPAPMQDPPGSAQPHDAVALHSGPSSTPISILAAAELGRAARAVVEGPGDGEAVLRSLFPAGGAPALPDAGATARVLLVDH